MIEWHTPLGVAPQAVAEAVDDVLDRQPVPANRARWGMSNPPVSALPPPALPRPPDAKRPLPQGT